MRNFKCAFKFLKFTNLNNEKYKKITAEWVRPLRAKNSVCGDIKSLSL